MDASQLPQNILLAALNSTLIALLLQLAHLLHILHDGRLSELKDPCM